MVEAKHSCKELEGKKYLWLVMSGNRYFKKKKKAADFQTLQESIVTVFKTIQ